MPLTLKQKLAGLEADRRRKEQRLADVEDDVAEAQLDGQRGEAMQMRKVAAKLEASIAEIDVDIRRVTEQLDNENLSASAAEHQEDREAQLKRLSFLTSEAARN